MTQENKPAPRIEDRGISSVSVLFGRIMWFIIGPAALMGVTYGIVTSGSGWLTALDVTFAVVVALMVWGRWHEQRSGVAMTAEGKPATWDHFHRYVRVLMPLAAGV
jgi:hypothetical protein